MFLNALWLKKCVIKQLIDAFCISYYSWSIQEICDTAVPEDSSLKVYCPDKYKTQRMWDEAVDECLTALKLVPDWLVTSKMMKNFLLLCMQMKI